MADASPVTAMDNAIGAFVLEGYRVTSRGPDSALLLKPKSLSANQLMVLGAIVVGLSLLGGTGILLAILVLLGFGVWFAAKRANRVQLSLGDDGRVVLRGDIPRLPERLQGQPRAAVRDPSGARLCPTCGRANPNSSSACTRCGQAFSADGGSK